MKETILQFGTGNFLRGFIGDFIQQLGEKGLYDGKIVIVQPTRGGKAQLINSRQGRYHLLVRGMENGQPVKRLETVESVSRAVDPYSDFAGYLALAQNPDLRFVISNTTEAGIEFDNGESFSIHQPCRSFPGKLTQLLYRRYQTGLPGWILLPCELIDRNADRLRECVLSYASLWQLGEDFENWLNRENRFCNTLVDRIVTGFPQGEQQEIFAGIGEEDPLLDTVEPFHLWVIEGNFEQELPLQKAGLHVVWTDDVTPYKKRKVRILNGSHTSLVFPSLLCGVQTVKESLDDKLLNSYLKACLEGCILPVLGETPEDMQFARDVLQRFANPYLQHRWSSIALNSVSKFSVRVLPTLLEWRAQKGENPLPLVFSLACLIRFYRDNPVQDAARDAVLNADTEAVLADSGLWGQDLSELTQTVEQCLEKIQKDGIREAIKWSIS